VKVSGFDKWSVKNQPYIHGGALSSRYQLAQFHLHWAQDNGNGSEHTVNGQWFPAEVWPDLVYDNK
jgi:carbonic anhydrase